MSSIREIALAKAIGGGGGGGVTPEPLSVTANGTYTAPSGTAYTPVTVNVPSGGVSVPAKDVNFRDYDGTIVNAYSKAEFLALSAMPANPSHDGLTAQGWNWSFADAQAYVSKYGRLEVGQMYITDDEKTHVYIHLEQGRTSPMLGVCPNGTVDVDWGDGTAHDTLTGTSTSSVVWTPTHHYAAPGDYVIKLTVNGEMALRGAKAANQGSYLLRYSSSGDERNHYYRYAIRKIEIGDNVAIGAFAFRSCFALEYGTIPDSTTYFQSYAFSGCYNMKYVVIPDSVTNIEAYAFENGYALTSIAMPGSLTGINNNAFYFCYTLLRITIPQRVSNINADLFSNCYGLASIIIPDGVTSITTPFSSCYGLGELHFTSTTPPTITSSTFSSIAADCIIYVPYSADHSVLDAYKTASNWSTYASQMQEEPE